MRLHDSLSCFRFEEFSPLKLRRRALHRLQPRKVELQKIASFPVSAFRSAIACSAFSLLLDAIYTLAFLFSKALIVSLPTPVFPPVTMMTLPERSGMSVTANLGLGGRLWSRSIQKCLDASGMVELWGKTSWRGTEDGREEDGGRRYVSVSTL